MIRSEDVRKEIKILDDVITKETATLGNIVKAITLVIKLMLDIRSNQVAVLKNKGIALRTKPEAKVIPSEEKK